MHFFSLSLSHFFTHLSLGKTYTIAGYLAETIVWVVIFFFIFWLPPFSSSFVFGLKGCIKLLAQFKNRQVESWLWCASLVYFKTRGPKSKIAKAALAAAMQHNPYVLPALLEDVGSKLIAQDHQQRMQGVMAGRTAMQEVSAAQFANNFKKHWYRDRDVVGWLREASAEAASGSENEGATTRAEFDASRVLCSNCAKLPAPGTQLSRCSKCRSAQYCGRECQLEHWKAGGHKTACGLKSNTNDVD
jgi:hypothetical protein